MLDILICFSNDLTLIIIVKIFNNSWIKVKPSTCRLAKGQEAWNCLNIAPVVIHILIRLM